MTYDRRFRLAGAALVDLLFGLPPTPHASRNPRAVPPALDALDDRIVPAIFNVAAGDEAGLVAAINAANDEASNPGVDTINISGTYTFTNPDNYWYGPDALPAISRRHHRRGRPEQRRGDRAQHRRGHTRVPAVLRVGRVERTGDRDPDAEERGTAKRAGERGRFAPGRGRA